MVWYGRGSRGRAGAAWHGDTVPGGRAQCGCVCLAAARYPVLARFRHEGENNSVVKNDTQCICSLTRALWSLPEVFLSPCILYMREDRGEAVSRGVGKSVCEKGNVVCVTSEVDSCVSLDSAV